MKRLLSLTISVLMLIIMVVPLFIGGTTVSAATDATSFFNWRDLSVWDTKADLQKSGNGIKITRKTDPETGKIAQGAGTLNMINVNVDVYPIIEVTLSEVNNSLFHALVSDAVDPEDYNYDVFLTGLKPKYYGTNESSDLNSSLDNCIKFPVAKGESGRNQPGVFRLNLKGMTGWSGYKSFRLQLVAEGSGEGGYIVVDSIKFLSSDPADNVNEDLTKGTNNGLWRTRDINHAKGLFSYNATNGMYVKATKGRVWKNIAIDVDQYPFLEIEVSKMTGTNPGFFVFLHSYNLSDNEGNVYGDCGSAKITAAGKYYINIKRIFLESNGHEVVSGVTPMFLAFAFESGNINNAHYIKSVKAVAAAPSTIEGDFSDATCLDHWKTRDGMNASFANGLKLTSAQGVGRAANECVSYNVDQYPFIDITLSEVGGEGVHVIANDFSGAYNEDKGAWERDADDFLSTVAITKPGTYRLNLKERTGWSGIKNFELSICGAKGSIKGASATVTKMVAVQGGIDTLNTRALYAGSEGATVSGSADKITISGQQGRVTTQASYNVSAYPMIEVTVDELNEGGILNPTASVWRSNQDRVDVKLGAITAPGVYRFNLVGPTGYIGNTAFELSFALETGVSTTAKISNVSAVRYGITSITTDFTEGVSSWNAIGGAAASNEGGMKLTGNAGRVSRMSYYNLTDAPKLKFALSEFNGAELAIAVDDGNGEVVIAEGLKEDNAELILDVADKTGWSGDKCYTLVFILGGSDGATVKVNSITALDAEGNAAVDKVPDTGDNITMLLGAIAVIAVLLATAIAVVITLRKRVYNA